MKKKLKITKSNATNKVQIAKKVVPSAQMAPPAKLVKPFSAAVIGTKIYINSIKLEKKAYVIKFQKQFITTAWLI